MNALPDYMLITFGLISLQYTKGHMKLLQKQKIWYFAHHYHHVCFYRAGFMQSGLSHERNVCLSSAWIV